MTGVLWAFLMGAVFSFLGSIPPGTINLSVLQLGIEGKVKTAWRLTLAATIVEYVYTWLAILFENWITSNPMVVENFQLITAIVMTILGVGNILSVRKPSRFNQKFQASGFRRGLVLGVLNPLALPYWVGVTAYLKAQGWITLSTNWHLHLYVIGTSVGVFSLLAVFTLLANRLSGYASQKTWIKMIPGGTLLVLGLYAFYKYLTG